MTKTKYIEVDALISLISKINSSVESFGLIAEIKNNSLEITIHEFCLLFTKEIPILEGELK